MIDEIKNKVSLILDKDNSGHGMEHIERVLRLALEFSKKENVNSDIVTIIALLHDVDDYKLVGYQDSINLTNTKRILDECNIADDIKKIVISEISRIGYSKYLKGIRPETLEGMIVSDADMCDGIGATGILRSYQYNISHGNLFFVKDIFPIMEMSSDQYVNKFEGTVVTHMFEKLLKLKDIMLTDAGKQEALSRHDFMVSFLYQYFKEENVDDWKEYLDKYLNN